MASLAVVVPDESILRLPEVEKRTGIARSTIYRHIDAGTFPQPVPLGTRHVGWLESEVQAWIATAADRRAGDDGPSLGDEPSRSRDLNIASRIRRSAGRTPRTENANARLTRRELDLLKAAAASQGKALGEWTREVLLAAATGTQMDRALFTEVTALRLFLTNVLRPLALGKTLSSAEFQAIQAGVRDDKHDAAQQLLAQYQPKRTEEQ